MTKRVHGKPAGDRCRWCGRPLPEPSTTGRPRAYCRRSCRQRDYEARRRAAELGLSEDELVVTRRELAALADQLYILKTAIDDVERDLAGTKPDVRDYAEALAWVLEAARPLCQMSKSGATPSQSGATPSQSGATPSQSGATPSKSGSIRPR